VSTNTDYSAILGHATLATSHVLFTQQMVDNEQINFNTKSGVLTVTRNTDGYSMDFPAVSPFLLHLVRQNVIATYALVLR